jgi:Fe-S cluster assembly protein SufD
VNAPALEHDALRAGLGRLGAAPAYVEELRGAAKRRFEELGIPTTRDEAWKYTGLQGLLRTDFRPGPATAHPDLQQAGLGFLKAASVFVDGRLSHSAGSGVGALRAGFSDPRLQGLLGTLAPWKDDTFAALNTACLEDGAWVEVEAGEAPRDPIVVVHLTSGGRVDHPRTLIHLGTGAAATVIEVYAGLPGDVYFANPVTEVALDEAASLDLVRVELQSEGAFHIERVSATQKRNSRFQCRNFVFGASLFRSDVGVRFAGEGGECTLEGLFVAHGSQHTDTATRIVHAVPHCSSREVYKGILGGRARGAFLGTIVVDKDAQKTDAYQTNRNLLLSKDALVTSVPRLEILADDVKCRHGSATGRLDPNALFYLRSRGLSLPEARALLVRAFGGDLIQHVRFEPLRDALLTELASRLASEPLED